MILVQIKEYIAKRASVSLQEMAWHFRMNTAELRPMLELLVKKGQIQKHGCISSCKRICCSCDSASIEYYFIE